jgi:hypothetical protein
MSLRSTILGTACAVAIVALSGPAFADLGGFSGTLQGQYSNTSAGNGGGSANVWGGAGSGAFDLGMSGLKVQVDGGYNEVNFSGGGGNVGDWNIDGALIWQGGMGRIGATVGYNGVSGGGGESFNLTNYGGFAEWYAGHMFTLGAKGGGATASGGGFTGTADYFGGEAVFYVVPDLALNADVDYLSVGSGENLTNYGGTVEWLVSESTPISVYGNYTYTELSSGGGHLTTWLVGVKFYLNNNGASTLVDRQRSGNANWGTETNLIDTVY